MCQRSLLGRKGTCAMSEFSGVTPTAADIMQPALSTVEPNDHVAAAAYLMHQAGATALVVVDDEQAKRPIGLITEADIVEAVAADKDLHGLKIRDLMTSAPVVATAETSLYDAARTMVTRHFRHLPVVAASSLTGMVGIGEVCQAMLDISQESQVRMGGDTA
jgi:CBS domain-containing protein